jgi:cobalt-factor III methyltransferase
LSGKISVIGLGPGNLENITGQASAAIINSDTIIGYDAYIDLVSDLITNQEVVRLGATEEVVRAQKAVQLAKEGKIVAVVSSGDAGVYGMAGLIFEVLIEQGWHAGDDPSIEVLPGISAIHSCGARLGAPIMHDACTISLSDHLTPWEIIEKRVEAAAQADFVIAFYNPKSRQRTKQIEEAQKILLKYRDPRTPVGLVKNAWRESEQIVCTTLGDMLNHEIGMLTTVIVGNSSTFLYEGLMITPRGYQRKYVLSSGEQPIPQDKRLHPENEPWALSARGNQ